MTVKTASSTSKTTAAKKAKPAAPKTPLAKPQTGRTSPSAPVKAKRAASPKSAPAKAAQAAAPVQAKPTPVSASPVAKDKKVKVVRDSFTIPKVELLQIGEMKKRALGLGVEIKKSELIRAGLSALAGMTDTAFKKALASVPTIKTGRPAKD